MQSFKPQVKMMPNSVILLNNKHYSTVDSVSLIDELVDMLKYELYVPARDIIEILSEQE